MLAQNQFTGPLPSGMGVLPLQVTCPGIMLYEACCIDLMFVMCPPPPRMLCVREEHAGAWATLHGMELAYAESSSNHVKHSEVLLERAAGLAPSLCHVSCCYQVRRQRRR